MTDNSWVHDLNPFLLRISGEFGIRWYGLAYLTGFVLCGLFMTWMAKNKKTPLTVEQASDFLTYIILGVMLGGRLGYITFYSPETFTDFRSEFPFWGVLAVWEGGMASHGGFLGVVIATYLFAKKHKINYFHLQDLTVYGAALGIFFGRIANFINGELMGKTCDPAFKFAVKFPQDILTWINYTPERLKSLNKVAEAMGKSSDFSLWMDNIGANKARLFNFAHQIIAETQNHNQAVIEALRPVLDPRHPSQLYAAVTEGLIPVIALTLFWKKPRRPGMVASLFLIFYSMGRIFNEIFRQPDAHIADLSQQPLGISRGQFISLFFLVFGVVIFIYLSRQKSKPMGGWGK